MIQEVDNIELFELLETDPKKTQCEACLSYLSVGIVYYSRYFLQKEYEVNRDFVKYTVHLFFRFP